MSKLMAAKGDKVHTRDIRFATYRFDKTHLLIEGELKDHRLIDQFDGHRAHLPPGVIHHMFIRLLVNMDTFSIDDVEIDMPGIPHDQCPEVIDNLMKIKGLRIAPGFTSTVRGLTGGPRGCAHLNGLLMAMASAAVQGLWVIRRGEKSKEKIPAEIMDQYLIDTCMVWRKDGPLAREMSTLPSRGA